MNVKKKSTLILIVILSLISTWYIFRMVILLNIDRRIEFANKILSGQQEAPYQYRILKPLLDKGLQRVISPYIHLPYVQHVISYSVILLVTFGGIFFLFYMFLQTLFTEKTSMIGILLLQAVIPLSVTGFFMIGDFITVFFYLVGFNLILSRKDIFLPVVIGIAAFNREQIIFLVVFYVIYLISQQRKFDKRSLFIVMTCILAFLIVFLGVRFYFGFKPNRYTMSLHIAINTNTNNLIFYILPLWLSEVFGVVVLCILAFKKSNAFFRLAFLSLGFYTILFFLNGRLWELAKFLPAFLIMIPMSLQVLSGEFVDQTLNRAATRDYEPQS